MILNYLILNYANCWVLVLPTIGLKQGFAKMPTSMHSYYCSNTVTLLMLSTYSKFYLPVFCSQLSISHDYARFMAPDT